MAQVGVVDKLSVKTQIKLHHQHSETGREISTCWLPNFATFLYNYPLTISAFYLEACISVHNSNVKPHDDDYSFGLVHHSSFQNNCISGS
jgi:hypothetical protein